jgi:hypothetical protein
MAQITGCHHEKGVNFSFFISNPYLSNAYLSPTSFRL